MSPVDRAASTSSMPVSSWTNQGSWLQTTTTAMVAHVLAECGLEPGWAIGAELQGANARLGAGEWMAVEADESDRSFLRLDPEVAVVTNVELDHHATYGSEPEVRAAFLRTLLFSTQVLLVQIPLGVAVAVVMPKRGIGVPFALVVVITG